LKKAHHKKRAGRVVPGVGPEFKPHTKKKKTKKSKGISSKAMILYANSNNNKSLKF
jgi:hypothetical protein